MRYIATKNSNLLLLGKLISTRIDQSEATYPLASDDDLKKMFQLGISYVEAIEDNVVTTTNIEEDIINSDDDAVVDKEKERKIVRFTKKK